MRIKDVFIPVFKWSKRYFVETSCCHRKYELNPEVGRDIARREDIEIRPEDLYREQGYYNPIKVCKNCGFRTEENFDFCPKCGERL